MGAPGNGHGLGKQEVFSGRIERVAGTVTGRVVLLVEVEGLPIPVACEYETPEALDQLIELLSVARKREWPQWSPDVED